MMSEPSASQLRRYVLGLSTEDEAAAIEREYFERPDTLGRVRAAEDDLVDDYVSDQLAPDERERFERRYLSTPCHRRRVAVARALMAAASASAKSSERRQSVVGWWPAAGVAAALAILVVAGMWMLSRGSGPGRVALDSPPLAPAAAPAAPPTDARGPDPRRADEQPQQPDAAALPRRDPLVVTLTISPILVRGADDPATVMLAAETDIVRLRLQGDAAERPQSPRRAIVRTVAGVEIWRGPATEVAGSRPPMFARIDIPADRLRPDDYIVELLGTGAGRREVELYRYFFRVRAR